MKIISYIKVFRSYDENHRCISFVSVLLLNLVLYFSPYAFDEIKVLSMPKKKKK